MVTLCHGKTNVMCVTWPKSAVCRWIYISIQYVEFLSRKNYRNVCHVDKLAVCRWKYMSIQYVDSLSCKNYQNVCHTALIPNFFKAFNHTILILSILVFHTISLITYDNLPFESIQNLLLKV